jgi:TDG/mug DNA glycosylase family protein
MTLLFGYPAIARTDATRLVLGIMPGKRSLEVQQYYAHPRNAFWGICAQALSFDATAPYEQRCTALLDAGIALWDVIGACERESSLDSDIDESTVKANDIGALLKRCPSVQSIYLNGATADRMFRRYVAPELGDRLATITLMKMPSTSPANARMNFEQKSERWSGVFDNPAL